MNLQRREEISALLAEPVTGGAGQVLEYRDALMECRTHIDTLEQTAAERVIADGSRGPTPDYTGEGSAWVPPVEEQTGVVRSLATRFGLFPDDVIEISRRVRAIPAGHALGDGMVAVSVSDLDSVLSEIDECAEWPHRCENSDIHRHSPAGKRIRATLIALRANQGGANE